MVAWNYAIVSVALLNFAWLLGTDACLSKFKNGTEIFDNVTTKCSRSLGIDNQGIARLRELFQEPGQDDKCFAKCIMEKLDLVKEDKVDLDTLFAFLEDQAPKSLVVKISESVTKCGDSAGLEKLTTEKYSPEEICTTLHNYYACFITSTEKLC